jgi:hypothetical protein
LFPTAARGYSEAKSLRETVNSLKKLAEEAVQYEPVSVLNLAKQGNLQGILPFRAVQRGLCVQFRSEFRWLPAKLPAKQNRGFFSWNREIFGPNRRTGKGIKA